MFNQDQTTISDTDDANDKVVKTQLDVIQSCEDIADWSDRPQIINRDRAYYSPIKDMIGIPDLQEFKSSELYYATLFHEMMHSTGAKNRLNRKGLTTVAGFGSKTYSEEEIIAELGASILSAKAGIFETIATHNSAYIDHWLKNLKADKRFIFKVMRQVQASVDLITINN